MTSLINQQKRDTALYNIKFTVCNDYWTITRLKGGSEHLSSIHKIFKKKTEWKNHVCLNPKPKSGPVSFSISLFSTPTAQLETLKIREYLSNSNLKNTTKGDPSPAIYTTLPSVLLSPVLLTYPLNENCCWLNTFTD